LKKELAKFGTYLRSRGLKLTRTRQMIFQEIFARPALHPNAEEIHQRLWAHQKRVSLATIYRTLNLLVKSGLVSSVDLGEDHSHFEPEGGQAAHGHLICLSCGKVLEFSQAEIQEAIARVGEEKGYRLDKFSLQVFGFCRDCEKK
jgi:Fur family ferric uptake transcriptional regulator